jgi:bacterioferritin-associated ferredoxin
MIACLCRGLSESAILAIIARGASTVAKIRAACGAGGDCGACCPMLAALVDQARRSRYGGGTASSYAPAEEAR